MFQIKHEQNMNANLDFFSLSDIKRNMDIKDGLNDQVLVYDFTVEKDAERFAKFPGRTNAIGLIIARKGEIVIEINAQEFVLKEGGAAIILPSCAYSVSARSELVEGCIFATSKELLEEVQIDLRHVIPVSKHVFHNPCFNLNAENLKLFEGYINMIRLVANKEADHSPSMLHGIIRSFLAFLHEVLDSEAVHIQPAKGSKAENRNINLFSDFMLLLNENFRSEHQIGFYADKLCLTPKYLSQLIKQVSSRSVSDWIDYCIVTEAKSLLRYSDLSIQQVAYSLHFPTPSFFGTYFKRKVGVTPGEFRQGTSVEVEK